MNLAAMGVIGRRFSTHATWSLRNHRRAAKGLSQQDHFDVTPHQDAARIGDSSDARESPSGEAAVAAAGGTGRRGGEALTLPQLAARPWASYLTSLNLIFFM